MVSLPLLPLAEMFIFGGNKKKDKKREWVKRLGLGEEEFNKIRATGIVFSGHETHEKIASLTDIDKEKNWRSTPAILREPLMGQRKILA